MSLDFSRGAARWSYSGFNRFRDRVAESTGITPLKAWFGGAHITHPLDPLLNHSDCDGDLLPEQMRRLEPALRELVLTWPEDDWDRHQALLLCTAMRECIADNVPLEFC